ncbi:DUF302 domain-containing protein [Christiangramia forsetii]|uniref:Protein containing DUF302 n=2 Tax=Christiangramia forsetii TaxID=411153 RepID=A0M0W7_CHRFK|nr:DUF302 domain-containing protein [Christiangramia forsetii]GGG43569.1 hypothetical protein GCM10011532_29500 [Christiangramia forsetii]CAL66262.1 protein containing DUF302 [Christiangramia forsetii KT0803]
MERKNPARKKGMKNQNYTESQHTAYCISQRYGSQPFAEILDNVKGALKRREFDILFELNLKDYLKDHLKDMPSQVILSVCNPETASSAISKDPQTGIFLPCSVTVKEVEQGNIEVSIEDTGVTWSPSKELTQLSKKITETLKGILSEAEQPGMKL